MPKPSEPLSDTVNHRPDATPLEDAPLHYRGKKTVRVIGVVVLGLCVILLVTGLILDTDALDPAVQLLFWGTCILLAVLAMFIALVDIMLVGRASRQRRLKLFQETFGQGSKD
jgi:hypothetical protein